MNRTVSVYAGVMAAMVSFSAGAQEPAPEAPLPPAPAEVYKPVNLSILSGLSTNGFSSGNVVNSLSLGLLTTNAGRVDGLAMAMVGNWMERESSGAALAMVANYAGQVKGVQMALGVNVAGGSMRGWQTSLGANVAAGEMVGAQLSTGVNIAAGETRGLQAAVGLNIAQDMVGVQTSPGLSIASRLEGAQISILNIGGDVSGAQVGIINVARRMKGLQLGLLNVAGEAEGANIGILSFVGNGQHHVQAWVSEMAMANVALKLGGKYFHTLLTVGMRPPHAGEPRLWATGLGFGGHIPVGLFFVDLDALASSMREGSFIDSGHNLLGQLRLVAGFQPFKHFAIFGGVTANTLVTWQGEAPSGTDRFKQGRIYYSDDVRVQVWPGLVAGIQI
ncbi:hypothetical protein JQX13_19140 [Archangium violaceum]|uniref:LA_2272 family surface repeat-containing protein n=1 Tax=Archangium violaceum TaxID=83451 RepID=UPI00193B1B10|nr:hypothetical protein [Archangium violaceum]QRK11976.1 hypothetical protein JQX13_19140 [Archangium violaceum]